MPAQDVACAILLCGGADVGKIITALRFSIGKRDYYIARDDLRDGCIGLCAADCLQSAATNHNSLKIRLNRDNLAKLFHNDRVFKRAAAKPTMIFGKRRAEHPEFLRKRPPDARITPGIAGDHLAALIKIIGVGQKTRECIADHILSFGVAEIHLGSVS